jgi:beta-glucosidase
VIEAWYPGARGGEAIAGVLFGRINPSGRLPVTFPRDEAQLPRPTIDDAADVTYHEGADVGYKWFDKRDAPPLFWFGHGLSYTTFSYRNLAARMSGTALTVGLDVVNTGPRDGIDTPQFYLRCPGELGFAMRLVGWGRVPLQPGETGHVAVTVDPRLLAHFDAATNEWRIAAGRCTLQAGAHARDVALTAEVTLVAGRLKP